MIKQSYQLRHKEWGVYQGNILGLGFWHLLSNTPEQGFYQFPSLEEVERWKDFLSGKIELYGQRCEQPTPAEDLSIEPFDEVTNKSLRLSYQGHDPSS